MNITVNGILLADQMEELLKHENGKHIISCVADLVRSDFQSEIKIVNYEFSQSCVVTKYEVFIIDNGNVTRTHKANLEGILGIIKDMWRQVN
jgi:hypothetical protein